MGGERFDTPQPEAYLFGENADLNFLGSHPTPVRFPVIFNYYINYNYTERVPNEFLATFRQRFESTHLIFPSLRLLLLLQFPYPPPQANEPTKTLKSLVNIRKESLRFVRCNDNVGKISDCDGAGQIKHTQFNIEFTFDCDSRCCITIYYFCSEEFTSAGVVSV